MSRKPPRLLGLSDIAKQVGMSRQAIADFLERGRMPAPNFRGPKDGPLWREATVSSWIQERRRDESS